MNILEQIIGERKKDVEFAKREVSVDDLMRNAKGRKHHSLAEKLASASLSIVAETKKASPSAGLLQDEYHPGDIARVYESAGAAGISVLTEPRHFLGSGAHLREVREMVDLPVLRKDFIADAYQVFEAAAWGADVVLLIVAALESAQLRDLYETALACGLEVLAESHSAEELEIALGLEDAIIGVNSRDLKTLKTDVNNAIELSAMVPAGRLSVAESGIKTSSDIIDLKKCGYNGFLVGEALLAGVDPGAALRELLERQV